MPVTTSELLEVVDDTASDLVDELVGTYSEVDEISVEVVL